jgi:hypothetical protein
VGIVFNDVRTPGDMDGFGLARWVHVERLEVLVPQCLVRRLPSLPRPASFVNSDQVEAGC